MRIAFGRFALNQNFESLSEQSVPREDSNTFAIDLMIGRFAPAEVVIVHGGQVVMNERVRVDAFDSAGKRKSVFLLAPTCLCRGQTERRSKAFPSGEKRVTHRCMNSGRLCFCL